MGPLVPALPPSGLRSLGWLEEERLANYSCLGPSSVSGSFRSSSHAACLNMWSEAPRGG